MAATLIWEAVKWAISKARKKVGAGAGRELRVHIFNGTTETFITVNETGVWKTEKIPTEPKALPPRPPS